MDYFVILKLKLLLQLGPDFCPLEHLHGMPTFFLLKVRSQGFRDQAGHSVTEI